MVPKYLSGSFSLVAMADKEDTDVGIEAHDADEPGWEGDAAPEADGLKKATKEVVRVTDEAGAIAAIPDSKSEYSLDDKILFYKERECLLLLLEARKLLSGDHHCKELSEIGRASCRERV